MQSRPADGIVKCMGTAWRTHRVAGLFVLFSTTLAGCNDSTTPLQEKQKPAEVKRIPADKNGNVILEMQGDRRRVLIQAEVCLREGQLEQLLCKKPSKEHEAILTADVDARVVHLALETAGAKAGRPVKYDPVYEPATGSRVRITLQYEQRGRKVTVPAQDWILNAKTKKNLATDWVFAGSQLVPNLDDKTKPPIYLANSGDIICVSNFPSAMLDLPVASPEKNADLVFVAHTERIPALDTKVLVILEPIPDVKK